MANSLDTERARETLSGKTTDEFVKACASATHFILTANARYPLATVVYNCEYSTVSATIIWLQTRGVVIPADILASLKIEGV